jgi:hypothetical protein
VKDLQRSEIVSCRDTSKKNYLWNKFRDVNMKRQDMADSYAANPRFLRAMTVHPIDFFKETI